MTEPADFWTILGEGGAGCPLREGKTSPRSDSRQVYYDSDEKPINRFTKGCGSENEKTLLS